jgi:hypothetical protein
MVFFSKFILTERERLPMVIFQFNVVHNCPNKLPLKCMNEKLSPSVAHASVLSFNRHKMVLPA